MRQGWTPNDKIKGRGRFFDGTIEKKKKTRAENIIQK